jgi:hypothetical protein
MAITLSQTDLEKIEVLDRGTNNWGIWSDKMQNYLLLKHGGGYILGLIMHPDPSVDPASASHWDLNNLCIIAALCTRSSSEEQEFLHPFVNAYLAWNALKSCHKKVGPIAQILLIQQALTVRYHHSEHLSTTSTQLSEMIRHIYAIGIPKEEDFLTIMMLNAMTDDLPHVRNHIADALSSSTPTSPTVSAYGPSNIHAHLDVEQQLIDTEKSKGGDVALLANGKGGGNTSGGRSKTCTECGRQGHSFCCTNCNSWGHLAKDCFAKGGSMEGKCEEVLTKKCAAHEANTGKGGANTGKGGATMKPTTKSASTGNPGGVHYDIGGHAYILDDETHEAIYGASPSATPALSTPATETISCEFAGLAYDNLTLAFIREVSDADDDEFTALYSALDTLQTSIDWCQHSQPVDFAGITYKVPNQRQRTIVDPSIIPFFLDSGTSVHISNTESDFFNLRPIPPCTVSGVGGSSIQAIGVGTL